MIGMMNNPSDPFGHHHPNHHSGGMMGQFGRGPPGSMHHGGGGHHHHGQHGGSMGHHHGGPNRPNSVMMHPNNAGGVGGGGIPLVMDTFRPPTVIGNPGGVNNNPHNNRLPPPINNNNPTIAGVVNRSNPMNVKNKFGSLGPGNNEFNSPHGFCLGENEDIVVADTNNHRIQVFRKDGSFRFEFGLPGKDDGQLWYPRKVVVVLKTCGPIYVVCDRGNERSRMQVFDSNGAYLKKIAIRYVDIVAGLAVDDKGKIIAVDSASPTVFVIDIDEEPEKELVHWFDMSNYMKEPSDIAVSNNEYFICDFKGHCVCVFSDKGHFLRSIGNKDKTSFPNGIDISKDGDVLVGDSHGYRFHISVFKRNGELQSEFDCPSIKVSRCCGLRITSEGFLVTFAKNNHPVLVLDTLYIP